MIDTAAFCTGRDVMDISDINAESVVVSSVALNPELLYHSEQLLAKHFTNQENAYLYYAISNLHIKKKISNMDAYNIYQYIKESDRCSHLADTVFTEAKIWDFLNAAPNIARKTPEEYRVYVDIVIDRAFRRDIFRRLDECKQLCFQTDKEEFEQKVYSAMDDVMMSYCSTTEVPPLKNIIDDLWSEIQSRQKNNGSSSGIDFKFPTLNEYVHIEQGELVVFAAEAKQGKSMMLLNCAVDLLWKKKKVLYIDSELNTRLFTTRLLSHLTGIEFARIRDGNYSESEAMNIQSRLNWLKKQDLTHIYMPMFDPQSIYTIVKKVKHTQGIDVLIVDYFKGRGDSDAFASYQELGRLVDKHLSTVNSLNCREALRAGQTTASA